MSLLMMILVMYLLLQFSDEFLVVGCRRVLVRPSAQRHHWQWWRRL